MQSAHALPGKLCTPISELDHPSRPSNPAHAHPVGPFPECETPLVGEIFVLHMADDGQPAQRRIRAGHGCLLGHRAR
ncbi:hypothetical protein LTA6_002245 [Microbacterium sp. LTA6]|uniref:hypothetical protein n=1 Tax=Microbacterium sp. LTA6 TaxID=3129771 RepID=UPI00324A1F4E